MLPVYGRLSPPMGEVTLGGAVAMDMRQARFQARFDGKTLTRRGFTHDLAVEVTVNVPCVNAACRGLPYDKPVMALLSQAEEGWELNLGPCADPMIEYPSPAERHRLRDCARGRCEETFN